MSNLLSFWSCAAMYADDVTCMHDDVTCMYDDVTCVYDDVTCVYDDVTYVQLALILVMRSDANASVCMYVTSSYIHVTSSCIHVTSSVCMYHE